MKMLHRGVLGLSAVIGLAVTSTAAVGGNDPLVPERSIPLGAVAGRIDHLAFDPSRQRLFVAELGNGSVGVIDLRAGRVIHRITGLSEPQGVGYVSGKDRLLVASAGDGSLRSFDGPDYRPSGRVALGGDADNVRIDGTRALVGFGNGGLAVVDGDNLAIVRKISLPAHPESFQLDPDGRRIFVNLPDARQVDVIDRATARIAAVWQVPKLRANFPMAMDPARGLVWIGFRGPARLVALDAKEGTVRADFESCGDADDIFVDGRRDRLYESCGNGYVDVYALASEPHRIARIATMPGARTALFVPELDRLFIAVRTHSGKPAEIRVYRPTP